MAKATFTMLAHKWNPDKQQIAGYWMSQKLDGQRALWMPESRGVPKEEVPYANLQHDERFAEAQTSTGLWSR